MVSRFVGRPLRSLLLHLSFLLFLLVVSIQGQNMEKRRPMGYRNLNPKFRANLMDMMMGDAPAAASCEGKKCDNDGDCYSGSVCVSSGVCVAHHEGGASQKDSVMIATWEKATTAAKD